MSQITKLALAILALSLLALWSCCPSKPLLDEDELLKKYIGEDAEWYHRNIPIFECSDKEMEQVYYYRWKMYKAHIRNIGENSFVITEFINPVPWNREPFCTINAASMHHLYEGRWLNDPRYMNGYINYLYQNGGNNRQYSESIADAAYARYLVHGDVDFITSQLDSMKAIFNRWDDHWDEDKKLYYITAMPDATEYTIASIDATGGKDGFDGQEAFRPTINSYMYGNALAIARIAQLKKDEKTANDYFHRAEALRQNVQTHLWNKDLTHFTDRFRVNNQYVRYWDFIRGRELAGFAPWYFNLPLADKKYFEAWKHVKDTSELLGKFGLRTNEPSYPYYFKQFLYFHGKRGSQWNGPSWPYQTSQTLTGMANVLNDYKQETVNTSDYLKLLRQFTRQHFLPDGKINLVENYDPNLGGPIVFFNWSHHYNHSTYNNLIISGLCGIRPSDSDTLTIHPLIDESIRYFCLSNVMYHGRRITVVYDKDGEKYKVGKGITVMVDDKKENLKQQGNNYLVAIGARHKIVVTNRPKNFALNIGKENHPIPSSQSRRRDDPFENLPPEPPIPSASVNNTPDSVYQAIDGRSWYFPEIANRWSTAGSTSDNDWYALDFGELKEITSVKIYIFVDDKNFALPDSISIETKNNSLWTPVKNCKSRPLIANTVNTFTFDKTLSAGIRINFKHSTRQVAISEIEVF